MKGIVLAGGSGNGLAVMRLLRIFRIVRIANRLENLRNILQANLCAMGPVTNAFLLFIVTVAIYSVIAVNLFSQQGAESDTDDSEVDFDPKLLLVQLNARKTQKTKKDTRKLQRWSSEVIKRVR